jgi:DNA transformation protein and related proteins
MRLVDLPNLGPQSAVLLREAGIETETELRALGAAAAYARVRFLCPNRASLNLLWALHGAIEGVDWRTLNAETKARLQHEASA